jgi:hypothetical protein
MLTYADDLFEKDLGASSLVVLLEVLSLLALLVQQYQY